MSEKQMDNPLAEVAENLAGTKVSTGMGIAAIALQMAIKYECDTVVKDGQLYQQYKLEGRNMEILNLDRVLDTAKQFEAHLIDSEQRIQALIAVSAMQLIEQVMAEEDAGQSDDQEGGQPT